MPRWKGYKYDEMAHAAFGMFRLNTPTIVAVDTETSGFGYYDEAFCVTMTWPERASGTLRSFYIDTEGDGRENRIDTVREILNGIDQWVFHNAKFDLQKLEMLRALPLGWQKRVQVDDTATLYALINENDRKGLKYLAHKFLGESTNEEKVLAKVRRAMKIKKDDGYHLLPRNVVLPYALKDTEYTLRLYRKLWPMLDPELHDLYRFEIGLELALLAVEDNGIGLDVPYLEQTASEYGAKVMQGQVALRRLSGNDSFNPNSPKQILEAFAERGVVLESSDKATLSGVDDELARVLLAYRSDKKLHSTYLTALLAEQRDGIIHPNFNLTTPRTGRMSSGAATNN